MKLITAPKYEYPDNGDPSLFLAGGITYCKPWQTTLIEQLKDYDVNIYNPRRDNFDVLDPKQSKKQIKWENHYITTTNIISFYFSEETLCPITLFELGAALERSTLQTEQDILIYCEPNYKRKFDVELQSKLITDDCYMTRDFFGFIKTYSNYKKFVKDLIYRIEFFKS